MKIAITLVRAIGILATLFMLYCLIWSFFQILPAARIESPQAAHLFNKLLWSSYLPGIITFTLLLLPFSRITSQRFWITAFGILTIGLLYWSLGILLMGSSLIEFTIFSLVGASQIFIISFQRLHFRRVAEQGAAANP